MKKHIPNMLTCCNLISGCIATSFALYNEYNLALSFIIIGAVFDFFDGFVARLLHVSSPIGKELDSLADCITFGFAPASLVFCLLNVFFADIDPGIIVFGTLFKPMDVVPYIAFLIAAFSGLRLAKFNVDERQATTFIGLPTPANALFWSSLCYILNNGDYIYPDPMNGLITLAALGLSCWLLVCEIPMFALKFKTYGLKGNELRYAFIAVSGILLLWQGWGGFSLVVILYVLISVCKHLFGTDIAEEQARS